MAAGERPNILLLMTDQQRYDSMGCYGADWVATPNLDRLASEGVIFDSAYADNPVCTPSRASLFTGKSVPGHGVYKLHDILPEDEICFPERLRSLGYRTALFGKMHVSGRLYEESRRHPHDGFDVYEWCLEGSLSMDSPLNGYAPWLKEKDPEFHRRLKTEGRGVLHHPQAVHMTRWAADRTISHLQNASADQPFFCMMSVFDPHNPYEDYPPEMGDRVDQDRIPAPIRRPETEKESSRPAGILRERDHSYLGPHGSFGREDLQRMRLGYYASISFFDQEAGRVLRTLDETGLAEKTLVIMTSDHGDMLGDHDLLVKGAYFYDPGVKVPLIMRWPGRIKPGVRSDAMVQLHDLAATVLGAAGAADREVSAWMPDALNLVASNDGGPGHDTAVCCYRNSGISDEGTAWDPPIHATMYRKGRHKLNVYHGELAGELYDMEVDPQETRNLWGDPDHETTRLELMTGLMDWMLHHELGGGSRGGEAVPRPADRLVNALRQRCKP